MATNNSGQNFAPSFAQWNAQIQQDTTMADAMRMRERRERRARRERARQNIQEAMDTIAKADDTLRTSRDADEKTRARETLNNATASLLHWNNIYDTEDHALSPTQFPIDNVLGLETGLGGSSKRRGTKKHQKGRKTRKTRKTKKGKRVRKSKKVHRLAKSSKRYKKISSRR